MIHLKQLHNPNGTFALGYYAMVAIHNADDYYTYTYEYDLFEIIPITDLVLKKDGVIDGDVVHWIFNITNKGPHDDYEVVLNESCFGTIAVFIPLNTCSMKYASNSLHTLISSSSVDSALLAFLREDSRVFILLFFAF